MANQGWKVVRPHVVMIAFRKGGHNRVDIGVDSLSHAARSGAGTLLKTVTDSTGPNVTQLPIIEDFQLPLRYRRRPLSDKEIEYINRGGPE